MLLHRDKADTVSLAKVLYQKSWLTIRQLVLELYRNQTIFFNCFARIWEWEPDTDKLAHMVRKLTGEEYVFLENRFRALDSDTKKTLICASICGPVFSIHDLQQLVSSSDTWAAKGCQNGSAEGAKASMESSISKEGTRDNKGCSAMAGLQTALREGILVYTSVPDHLRFHHGIMRKVAVNMLEGQEQTEELHFQMAQILFRTPGQEFRIASHVLQSLNLIKSKIAQEGVHLESTAHTPLAPGDSEMEDIQGQGDSDEEDVKPARLDTRALRMVLALAGEKSQKSGAQDMALAYWRAALSLLPEDCWEGQMDSSDPPTTEDVEMEEVNNNDNISGRSSPAPRSYQKATLYHETLKLHLQCIEAERWREHFDSAMDICNVVLAKVKNPIDRARVYQHQIEMSVWAYSRAEQATAIAMQCMRELGYADDFNFNPTEDEMRVMFAETHKMLLEHIDELQKVPHRICTDPKISMMMEVLSVANASLYYCNIPFMAAGIAYSMKVLCEHGITKDAGRALVSFALTHSTWYGCIKKAFELGQLACAISNGSHHVRFLFYLTVQQWGDHIANSIPAIDEAITAVDLTCDRLFHTSGMLHVSLMRVLLGRVHLNDCMSTTVDLLAKHVEFGPKSHGVEVMHGVIQMIKCLKGRTLVSNPETIFDDADYSESKIHGKRDKALTMVHNNSTYQLLKIVSALIFEYYAYIEQVADPWHDDPKSIMNFESSYLSHYIFMTVGLALVNLLRVKDQTTEVRALRLQRLKSIRDRMETHALQYPTNHAAMFYLVEAELADQEEPQDMKKTFLLYEKAIEYSTTGDFPLHKCLSYEMAGKCHLRHGLVTSARCLMANALKGYQIWGAKGKVSWFHKTYPKLFPVAVEPEPIGPKRGLFYRPTENMYPGVGVSSSSSSGNNHHRNNSYSNNNSSGSGTLTSPWMNSGSPSSTYSPSMFGADAVSAAAAAMAESCLTSSFPTSTSTANGCPSAGSSHSSAISAPLYTLQSSSWLGSPQSPEMDNADLDVLDFSSVIEAMQVIASEIDLDLLLIKSLGVLNQSVSAKRCCIIISKDQELVLAASQGDLGRCESVNPPMEVEKCQTLFHGVINYVINTSAPCLLTNAKDDPRFCADEYLKQRAELRTVLCAPILHKAALVGVLYMEDFPERAFANKRMLVMNLLVQQLGISITNALLYQSVLQSEAKLNGLLENMPCGIALWDAQAETCHYINSGWSDMTGFTIEEIMSSSWQVLMPPDDLVVHGIAWRERVAAGKPCQWETRYGLKDGTFRWGIVRMLPIKASPTSTTHPDKILQWLTVTIDIDDQRRAVQLKSNFLANMSHELRTPFSGILGMLSLLRDSSGLSSEQFEFVDMAKASCEMLIRIVDDLLNFSKLEADKVTLEYIPFCFEEVLGDVCDLLIPLASRKGLELIVLLDPTLPLLLIGDPDRLKQILMNLIGNAIKFSTKGNVVVKYWHERIPRSKAHKLKKQEQRKILDQLHYGQCKLDTTSYRVKHGINDVDSDCSSASEEIGRLGDDIILHCSVTDQGIGLSPEEQKMLFVSFQQTDNGTTRKYGGTGLGLSICAQLIAHMKGKITVDSEKGKGSTFTFTANIRTMTDYDQEQNPAESTRILECQRVLHLRWKALRPSKVLILSPNRLLREQITKTVPGAEYIQFDDVASVLESGMLGTIDDSQDLGSASGQDDAEKTTAGDTPMSGLQQFDYILVDHVLDSAVLDRIYPSPTVAFILLLAPTTETLRWILPPAQKPAQDSDEEIESDQLDVGGRGRIQQASDLDFAQRAVGRVNSVSYISALKGGDMGLSNGHGTGSAASVNGSCTVVSLDGAGSDQIKSVATKKTTPSQLFKKRKSGRGPVTLKRHVVPRRSQVTPETSSSSSSSGSGSSGTGSSFQVCRMIKPVRRLKLLQIMYNALMHQRQGLKEARLEEIVEDGDDISSRRARSMSPVTGISTYSVSSSLKRPLEEEGPTKRDGEDVDVKASPDNEKSATTADRNDPPKRARNNDALTLLLTQEELKRCRGINVLVAEDDFVSQKILEKQLSKLGMNVVIANNGQQAVNQWLAVDRGFYTIAIFDHHMPIMDGLAATKKIRALEAGFAEEMRKQSPEAENQTDNEMPHRGADSVVQRIPIVGLSADIQHTTKESCIRAGMDEYMTKPLLTKGLALLIQRYCCR
ncbi:histidine kinase osmosensor [Podila epicladia]|nr:histidine kinase osmosensor [Podila epicladia]